MRAGPSGPTGRTTCGTRHDNSAAGPDCRLQPTSCICHSGRCFGVGKCLLLSITSRVSARLALLRDFAAGRREERTGNH